MASLYAGNSAGIAEWVAAHIPHVNEFGPCEAVGVVSNGALIAGVVFHDYQPSCQSIQISMAAISPMWARKETIAQLLAYPFRQLGCYRVWTGTPISNKLAIKVNKHIGFTSEGVLNSMFGKGKHGVIMRMLEPDFKHLYARYLNGQT